MKIGIDARLLERKMTGIGRFLTCLLDSIPKLDQENEYYLFSSGGLDGYKERGFKVIATGKNKMVPDIFYSPYWLNFVLPGYLKKNRIDAFFSPTGFIPLAGGEYKTLITVCDVFHKVDKKFHPFFYRLYADLFLAPAVKRSDLIFTISQNSKKDILKSYKVSEEKVRVAHLAADEIFKPRDLADCEKKRLMQKYGLPEKFILYVGVLEERKNIKAIVKTADLLAEKTDAPILLFGKPGHGSKKYLKEIAERKNIRYKGFADKDDLPLLYNLASVFFFPTYYEGFGLPVLEAMQSGLPVVTSNTSSLPEIVGEKGLVCAPNDYRCFAGYMENLLKNGNFYDKMAKEGIERAKNFHWNKTSKIIIDLFKSL